jgi:hypothetical protein
MSTLQTNKNRGQIAIEFLLLVGLSFAIIIILMISVFYLSEDNTTRKTYTDLMDFGRSLQQELLLASNLEDGYIRPINIPLTVNGLDFNITTGTYNSTGYLILSYKATETFFVVPSVNGSFIKGKNIIRKMNNTLYIN